MHDEDANEMIENTVPHPFSTLLPKEHIMPVVISSPHSGRHYPAHFIKASKLNPMRLRMSEDCYVDELFTPAAQLGAPLVSANFPRAYLDLNREAYELDAAMFHDDLPSYVNTRSARVAGGLGTIARVVTETEEIYREKLYFKDAKARIEAIHTPYHNQLRTLIEDGHARFSQVLLLDCHSMPSATRLYNIPKRADFILGDRCSTSCSGQITDFFEQQLTSLGYTVSRNQPYAGGYITQNYGTPDTGRHALQIEINRARYLNEETLEKHDGFEKLQAALSEVFQNLASNWPSLLNVYSNAAE